MKKRVVRKIGLKKAAPRPLPAMQVQQPNLAVNWFGWNNNAPAPARDFVPAVDPVKRKFGQTLKDKPFANPLFHQAFPSCCGIGAVTNFGVGVEKADILRGIKELDKQSRNGLHLISLNPGQVKEHEKTVLEAGYEVFKKFMNPNHGHHVTLYGKVLSQ